MAARRIIWPLIAVVSAVSLFPVAASPPVVGAAPVQEPGGYWEDGTDPSLVGGVREEPRDVGTEPLQPEAELPSPGRSTAEVVDSRASARSRMRGGGSPVAAVAADGSGRGSVAVEVHDSRTVPGVEAGRGFVFSVWSDEPGRSEAVELAIDVSSLRERFGASFMDRLVVRRVAPCELADKVSSECESGPRVASTFEDDVLVTSPRTLESETSEESGPLATAESGQMFMVSSSVDGGASGTYGATPLDSSASWQVGPGSGEFSWTYPLPVFPAPAGAAPELALSYSSASVDGMVGGENNQAGQAGLGWSITEAYVERRYWSCRSDGWSITDLCWHSNNATLVLNGKASELVHLSGSEWRLKDDPNWRVVHGTGRPNGDNDGEHWIVYTPDGTRYEFGAGGSALQHSTWTVPVFGDDAGEPRCTAHQVGLSWCRQAWRWNLDRIVDRHANVAALYYGVETNKYGMGGYPAHDTEYDRGGYLDFIDYGRRQGVADGVMARVDVQTAFRCNTLSTACPAPTAANGSSFPDVPNDLICTGTSCSTYSPSFFSGVRYWRFSFQALSSAGSLVEVDAVRLRHDFVAGGQSLWLRYIDRAGYAPGAGVGLPAVRLDSANGFLPNRIDGTLKHYRLNRINDHFGAQIDVTYGQPTPCTGPYPPSTGAETWDVNEEDCFPKYWVPESGPAGFGIFHKYVATSVTVTDLVSAAKPVVTSYSYEGTPMWAHAHPPGSSTSTQTWNDWRGYGSVRVTEGITGEKSATELSVFRGMHGDKLVGGATRNVVVSVPGTASSYTDQPWLAGRVFSERNLDVLPDGSVPGGALRGVVTEYTAPVTAGSGVNAARFVAESSRRERWASTGGTRYRTTTTTYDPNRLPNNVADTGWEHISGDERCVHTTWASNTTTWKLAYPQQRVTSSSDACFGGNMFDERWFYDGQTSLGPVPLSGNVTQHQRLQAAGWATESFTYDPLGRQRTATNAVNATTTTAYSPTTGYPSSVTVTNPLGHKTVTAMHTQRRDLPATVTDPNGNQTILAYDALGRTTSVRLHGDAASDPSLRYTYVVDPDKNSPHAIVTQTRTATGHRSSTTVYDGMLRERQTHTQSPTAGKVMVTSLLRDHRGHVIDTTLPYVANAAPYTVIGWPAGVDQDTATIDELGRVTRVDRRQNSAVAYSTTTAYTFDTTTVTPPVGSPTATVTDGLGRTTRVVEYGNAGANTTTSYSYVGGTDLLAGINPPGGSAFATTMSYDRAGRMTGRNDPNSGTSTIGYDAADRTTAVTDGNGDRVFTWYDPLGRPVGTADALGQTTRPASPPTTYVAGLLTQHTYDTATKGLGQTASATRHDAHGLIRTLVGAYDNRGRPTATTMEIGGTAAAGTYTYGHTYTHDDQVASMTLPAAGDLPAETVTVGFDTVGQPSRLTSNRAGVIVDGTARDGLGNITARHLANHGLVSGAAAPNRTTRAYSWHADTRRLAGATTTVAGAGQVHAASYTWDHIGNVKAIATSTMGVAEDRQCFGYDGRNRLTQAYTTTHANTACTRTVGGLGPYPYDHTYAFDQNHRMTSTTVGGTGQAYTYTTARPVSAPASHAGTTYAWNPDGTLAGETGAVTAAYAWTVDGLLDSLTRDGTSQQYRYGPDGNRVVRSDDTGDTFTVYLPGQEVTVTPEGVTTRRTYTLGGTTIAVGDATGLTLQVNDHQATPAAWIDQTSGETTIRRQDPYGQSRGPLPTDAPNDHGFLDKVEDATGLTQLEARYYNGPPRHFTAPDPITAPYDPASLNRYSYSRNNPTTYSDPTGLVPCVDIDCRQTLPPNHSQRARSAPGSSRSGSSSGGTGTLGCGSPGFIGPCVLPEQRPPPRLVQGIGEEDSYQAAGTRRYDSAWFAEKARMRYGNGRTYTYNIVYALDPSSLVTEAAGSDVNLLLCAIKLCMEEEWLVQRGQGYRLTYAPDGVAVSRGTIQIGTTLSTVSLLGDGSTEPPDADPSPLGMVLYAIDLLGLNSNTSTSTMGQFTTDGSSTAYPHAALVSPSALVFHCHDFRCTPTG